MYQEKYPLPHPLVWGRLMVKILESLLLTALAVPGLGSTARILLKATMLAVAATVGVVTQKIIVLLECTGLESLDYSTLIGLKRYKLGRLPYGEPIYGCQTRGQIALTFDDGPYYYTARLLDILKAAKVNATFFITGGNLGKGHIDDPALPWKSLIRRIWTHADLSTLPESRRREEIHRLEYAFSKILGKIPTYMRPPYSNCDDSCLATMGDLGYHVIYFDLDTEDYLHRLPNQIKDSIKIATDAI
ncbi:hypothetical protein TWF481_000625 [Arthrobotrys musiformis]|uniref:NodB homology domain-containing protein n=1 Tax=Arthrobotrys musiformis TaxID=47236 RepID=A0AAV9WP90_9PEZI